MVHQGGYQLTPFYNEFSIDIYILLDHPSSKYIAIDWDNTISCNPAFYQSIIGAFLQEGFKPFICTLRAPDKESIEEMRSFHEYHNIELHMTNGQSKKKHMENLGIKVHLWIDDFYPGIAPCDSKIFRKNKIDY